MMQTWTRYSGWFLGCLFATTSLAQNTTNPQQVNPDNSNLPDISEVTPLPLESSLPGAPIEGYLMEETLAELDYSSALAAAADEWSVQPYPEVLAPEKDALPNTKGKVVAEWTSALQARGYLPQETIPLDSVGLSQPNEALLALSPPGTSAPAATELVFDDTLQAAIIAAQADYGLNTDGMAGPYLRANLNADPQKTAEEFLAWKATVDKAAKEAWDKGYRRLVVVNIPSFTLHAIDLVTGSTELESRVVIGMPSRRTPRFTTHIVNLKYNPDWSPPPSLIKRGRHYMKPGPSNPLGMIRFSTENANNIYLHDTNEPDLFEATNRAHSSGCIRVQSWLALAAFVSGHDEETISAEVATRKTHYEPISPVQVITTYSLVDVVAGRPGRYVDVYGLGPLKMPENLSASSGQPAGGQKGMGGS